MAGLPNSSNALQQWHHLFESQSGQRSPQAHQHLQQLLRLGLPTRKHENWKYTPLDALLNQTFVAAQPQTLTAARRDERSVSAFDRKPGDHRYPYSGQAQPAPG